MRPVPKPFATRIEAHRPFNAIAPGMSSPAPGQLPGTVL
jgi:hypothetical protein